MRKALIKAYTMLNLGDDLFVNILCNRYPQIQFTILCPSKYSKSFKSIRNLDVIELNQFQINLHRLFRKFGLDSNWDRKNRNLAKKFRDVIYIGGSIFIEQGKWLITWRRFNEEVHLSENFFIIGCNFGPYHSRSFHEKYFQSFTELNDICFRDSKSYDDFQSISNARLSTDVVFSMKDPNENDFAVSRNADSKIFIISVMDLLTKPKLSHLAHTYETRILDLIRVFNNNHMDVLLYSFCDAHGDNQAIKRITDSLSEENIDGIKTYSYDGDLEKALDLFSSCSGVVATRFHSFILALLYRKRVFPIVYDEKTENIINDIEFIGDSLSIQDIELLDPQVVYSQLVSQPITSVSEEIELAELQFKQTDLFFSSL